VIAVGEVHAQEHLDLADAEGHEVLECQPALAADLERSPQRVALEEVLERAHDDVDGDTLVFLLDRDLVLVLEEPEGESLGGRVDGRGRDNGLTTLRGALHRRAPRAPLGGAAPVVHHPGVDDRADQRLLVLRRRQAVVRAQEGLDRVVDDAAGPQRQRRQLLQPVDLRVVERGVVRVVVAPLAAREGVVAGGRPREGPGPGRDVASPGGIRHLAGL
jgi:hypothetical protein